MKGKTIPASQFHKAFKSTMSKYCRIKISIHNYHQVIVQISWTYLGHEVDIDDELKWDVVAVQCNHTVQTAHRIYTPEVGHLSSRPAKLFFGSLLPLKHGGVSLGLFLEKVLYLCM